MSPHPSRRLALSTLAMEALAPWEWAAAMAWRWRLDTWPKAKGGPVLVLPGLGMPDLSMKVMRSALDQLGHTSYAWGLGFNTGPRAALLKAIARQISTLADKHGEKVAVVGWSLGGAMGRAAAGRALSDVKCVIGFGAPMGRRVATHLDGAFEVISGLSPTDKRFSKWMRHPLPGVAVSSITSQGDGLLHWHSGILDKHPLHETIVVRGISHMGMPAHPMILNIVHDRLLQSARKWKPYEPQGSWESLWLMPTLTIPPRRGKARAA